MTSVEDSTDNIGGLEKINTLWKISNNLINTKPASFAVNEEIPFRNFVVSSEILNQTIPDNIPVIQNTTINIKLPTNNTIQITITPSDTSFVTIPFLDDLFDSCNNILSGSICNFENFGYEYIEFFYKRECYPTIYGTTTQIYTWFIPDPSNGNITNSNTKNLLKNTIPYLFDPYNNTYKFNIFYKASNGTFVTIPLASNPDFAYIDNKSGFLYFYGGTRTDNNVILDNIRSQNDSNPSPPYISYIRYNGNIGFDNLNLTGNTIIDGSLSIINDNSFSDISNLAYNILNTQQIKQYVENLNISGGSNNNSNTNFSNKYIFDVSDITTTNTSLQDLSALFFNTITPSKNNSNILININVTLFCSYALEERINVELWRDLSMLTQSKDIGYVIATGGSNIPYYLTYLDENINNTQKKYYLKYQMENNNSQQNMGLVNLQTSQNNGSSSFLLREI